MKGSQTILITGGAGFIGANLVHALLRKQPGPQIHVLTEPNTDYWRLANADGIPGPSRRPNVAMAGRQARNDNPNFTIHEINLTDFEHVIALVHAIKPSTIFHLASFGGFHSQSDQTTIYNVNLHGTINMLNACKDVGFDCFINTGSSSEYGMKDAPMREDLVLEPISDYGVSKAAATQFCLKEALVNKLAIYTVRPFAVYGDYELHTRLIPTVITNALANTPVQLSAPHFVRDYMYIKDMVDLYLTIAEQRPTSAYVFNGGTGAQSTIQNVVDTVQALCGRTIDVRWGAHVPRPWEPTRWQADTTRAHAVLGWRAQYNLKQGLEASMRWFLSHPSTHFLQSKKHSGRTGTKRTNQRSTTS